ncbi:hypothetical protein DHD80_04510 [Gramella sp. AN32]|nr:hypothetical protein [Gramella sp. AN32]
MTNALSHLAESKCASRISVHWLLLIVHEIPPFGRNDLGDILLIIYYSEAFNSGSHSERSEESHGETA